MPVAIDTGLVTHRLGKSLPEGNTDIFNGVVRVNVQVTLGVYLEVDHAVARNLLEHVLEKRYTGIKVMLAAAIEVHPFGLMVAAVTAATFAFMLPVATPPNAIVFSSRYVTIQQMVRAGVWLNLLGVILITLFVYLLLPLVWGIDLEGGAGLIPRPAPGP